LLEFKIASFDTVIIYFGNKIKPSINEKISLYYQSLKQKRYPFIPTIIPSYTSILIKFDIFQFDMDDFIKFLKDELLEIEKNRKNIVLKKSVKIPVYYSKEVGFDLQRVADINSISIDEVIHKHCNKRYLVYAIGFMPAFAYMAEVDKSIATPRLDNPRDIIPKGSVAIADIQTSIYPKNSPGGWNIIGKTPLNLYNPKLKSKSVLRVGYSVEFYPVSKKEFLKMGGEL
jgi:KipI family sensor histidine kinase inhibitor